MFGAYYKTPYICTRKRGNSSVGRAVRVASSSLVFRSSLKGCSNGGIGRHEGLKIPWPLRLCGFKSRFEYEVKSQSFV